METDIDGDLAFAARLITVASTITIDHFFGRRKWKETSGHPEKRRGK